jgi:hypothetical protein
MRKSMDDPNTTTGTLETEEDILTYRVSDDALEAAADMVLPGAELSGTYCPPATYSGCPG